MQSAGEGCEWATALTERDVVGLEGARDVGRGLGADDGGEGLAGERVGRRVDARDLHTDG